MSPDLDSTSMMGGDPLVWLVVIGALWVVATVATQWVNHQRQREALRTMGIEPEEETNDENA